MTTVVQNSGVDASDLQVTAQAEFAGPILSRYQISGNGIGASGEPRVLYVWLTGGTIASPTGQASGGASLEDFPDAETLELLSDSQFMEALRTAEHDLADGRTISGEELRRRA